MKLSDDDIDRLYINPVIGLIGERNTSAVPKEQLAISHVVLFAGTLINGGLLQYFIDTKGEYVPELSRGLVAIGEPASADLIHQALSLFQGRLEQVSEGQDFRIVLSGDKELAKAITALEKKFPDGVDLYKKAMAVARSHLSDFVRLG